MRTAGLSLKHMCTSGLTCLRLRLRVENLIGSSMQIKVGVRGVFSHVQHSTPDFKKTDSYLLSVYGKGNCGGVWVLSHYLYLSPFFKGNSGHISALHRYQMEAVFHNLILLSLKLCTIARVKTDLRKGPEDFLELILLFFPIFFS